MATKGAGKNIKSNFSLSFNNSFNTSFATNNNNSVEKKSRQRSSPEYEAPPSVTLSAQAVVEGKTLIYHGPLTIDLTDLEKTLQAKM